MVRGLERRVIFRDDGDRADFVARIARLAEGSAWTVYAWALLSNHAHLLVRTAERPLPRSMRSLLTGYAGAFNRRHRRVGHLFQNRYKSVVVEEERYFLELVRYIHLNPLRTKVVSDLRTLDRYLWTGHSALLGHVRRQWQATAEVLGRFASRVGRARTHNRAFVHAGMLQGRRPELQGGGLMRSAAGWAAVAALRRGREAYVADERILGGADFVGAVRAEVEAVARHRAQLHVRTPDLATLVRRVSAAAGVAPTALTGGGRTRAVTRVRDGLAYLWVEVLGRSGRALAEALGLQPMSVYRAARRGRVHRAEWARVVGDLEMR
jgi:REP element-mobilizing transposase RayT